MAVRVFAVVAFIATIVVNALANILPFNGQTTGEVSDSIPIYFVPAAYVFTIWTLIYLLLFGFVIYLFTEQGRKKEKIQRVIWLFIGTSIANSIWMFLWHYEYIATSVLCMLLILALLIAIYFQLCSKKRALKIDIEYMLLHLPFSVYLGWICVATIANVSAMLYVYEWSGWGIEPQTWAAIMIAVASLIGIGLILRCRDVVISLVLIWAIIGILAKQYDIAVIRYTALSVIILLFLFIGFHVLRDHNRTSTK